MTNQNTLLPKFFKEKGLLAEKFVLLDIGASGGIDPVWENTFKEQLVAYGFDPLVNEVERLNHLTTNKNIHYVDAFITPSKGAGDITRDPVADQPYPRSSATYAQELKKFDYVKERFNSGQEMRLSQNYLSIDDFCKNQQIDSVDFIKVDTDGHDFQALQTTPQTLKKVLGVFVEAQFHGLPRDDNNNFCNIDRFLRENGFYLFDIEAYKYSRRNLPRAFLYDIYAQTTTGQTVWGEALYLRDFVFESPHVKNNITTDSILKLACLYELFDLQDCALELLEKYNVLEKKDLDFIKDGFANQLTNGRLSYEAYMKLFRNNPDSFFSHQYPLSTGQKDVSSYAKHIRGILRKMYYKIKA